jgi:ferritin-like metal-binding protein YciE
MENIMATEGLRDLFVSDLQYLYYADRQLQKVFPRLGKAAKAKSLQRLCREGVEYTAERLDRLETIFNHLKVSPRAKTSHGMKGLLEEATEVAGKAKLAGGVRDAALLSAIQRISHYGIASYGTAAAYADAVGEKRAAKILAKSLKEKKEADEEMTGMAEAEINPNAMKSEDG